jgi:hypothetical protein
MKMLLASLRKGDGGSWIGLALLRRFEPERYVVGKGRATLLWRPVVFEAWLGLLETASLESYDRNSRRRHATLTRNAMDEDLRPAALGYKWQEVGRRVDGQRFTEGSVE